MLQLKVAAPEKSEQRGPGGWGGRVADQGGRLREWCRTWSSNVGDFGCLSCRQGKDIGFKEEGKWKMYPRLNWSESVYQAEWKWKWNYLPSPRSSLTVEHSQLVIDRVCCHLGSYFSHTYYPMPVYVYYQQHHWRNSYQTGILFKVINMIGNDINFTWWLLCSFWAARLRKTRLIEDT